MQVQEQDIFEQVRNTPNLRTSEFRELLVEHAKTARGIKSEAGIEAAYNAAFALGHTYGFGEVLIHFVDLLEICEACEHNTNTMGWLDADAIIAHDREREHPLGSEEIYGAIRSIADKPHLAPKFLSALVDANYMRGHGDGYDDGYNEASGSIRGFEGVTWYSVICYANPKLPNLSSWGIGAMASVANGSRCRSRTRRSLNTNRTAR